MVADSAAASAVLSEHWLTESVLSPSFVKQVSGAGTLQAEPLFCNAGATMMVLGSYCRQPSAL